VWGSQEQQREQTKSERGKKSLQRERNTRSSHGRARHIRHGEREERRWKRSGKRRRRRCCEKTAERETVIGHRKQKGQHIIGMKRRESGVIGRKEEAKRRKTGEAKLIGWRGWKIEAGGRESGVIGRKEAAKRLKTGEAKLIGRRGWKIEAGGRDSVVSGRKERAKRREAGEEMLIGWRARRYLQAKETYF
jgi:hypothetical protein